MPTAGTKRNNHATSTAYYLSDQQRARIKQLSRSWLWRLELPTWVLIGVIYTGWFAGVIYWGNCLGFDKKEKAPRVGGALTIGLN